MIEIDVVEIVHERVDILLVRDYWTIQSQIPQRELLRPVLRLLVLLLPLLAHHGVLVRYIPTILILAPYNVIIFV